MVTNDVASAFPETGLRAFHLDTKGAIVYPMTITSSSKALYLDIEGAAPSEVIATLDHFLVMERCTLDDATGGLQSFWVFGDIMAAFSEIEYVLEGNLHTWTIGTDLIYAVPVRRCDETCFVMWSDSVDLVEVFERYGVHIGTYDVAESARIHAGIPAGVRDFSRILAMESGITKSTISFTKGCYIGQEVTARIDARGRTHRELVLLELAGEISTSDVHTGDALVGTIRSSGRNLNGEWAAICHLRNESRSERLVVGDVAVLCVRDVS